MGMENKKIVAPAGVDVKSFMGGGLRIPEGYKGVIEDGVFRLVKQESEDERIRNGLILHLKELREWKAGSMSPIKVKEHYDAWIAYLEKQKDSLHISETCKENVDSFTYEDERIRKELIEQVEYILPDKKEYDDEGRVLPAYHKRIEQYRAYLEKQKPNIELIQRSWYMEGYHDREFGQEPKWIIKPGKGGPKYEKNEKYGQPLEQKPGLCDMGRWDEESYNNGIHHVLHNPEAYGLTKQNPAEWSEEDEKMMNSIIDVLEGESARCVSEDGSVVYENDYYEEVDWLKSLRPQPKQEWSEEDEKMLEAIVGDIHCGADFSAEVIHEANKREKWLRALRPQPKPEWSEEDETMWSNLIGYLEGKVGMLPSGKERNIKWLKERFVKLVYPKSSWKPSEEQMRCLEFAIKQLERNYLIGPGRAEDKGLYQLVNDLKKL